MISRAEPSFPLYNQIMENLEAYVAEIRESYREKAQALGDIYIENFSYLHAYIREGKGIKIFKGIFKGSELPAVIVGAGPSLDQHVEALKASKDNCFIICLDAAYPVLEKNGIQPHCIVCLDHSDRQWFNFKDRDLQGTFVMLSTTIHPLTFDEVRRSKGRVLWFNIADGSTPVCKAISKMSGGKGALYPGSLTSSGAMQLAIWMGIEKMAFIGHDLCYLDLNKGYSEEVSEDKKNFQKMTKIDRDLIPFPDINGKEVMTHESFVTFYGWINETSQTMWPSVQLFNCSGQGILHGPKIVQMSFDNFLKYHGRQDLGEEATKFMNELWIAYRNQLDDIIDVEPIEPN